MSDIPSPKVVNTHWFGSQANLPTNTHYIGRPSSHGNAYSSKSGLYTRGESIANHRVDLYDRLITDPEHLAQLRAELGGQDLACWCKQPNRVVGCHGDTLLHVLSLELTERVYDKSVWFYLTDDIRRALTKLDQHILMAESSLDEFYAHLFLQEVRMVLNWAIPGCRDLDLDPRSRCVFLALMAVDLELALQETSLIMIDYHLQRVVWYCNRLLLPASAGHEPVDPQAPLTHKSERA